MSTSVGEGAASGNARRQRAAAFFRALRDRIRAAFEEIEDSARFVETAWDRTDHDGSPGGGGVMSLMKGTVFEKVGVNISTVDGTLPPDFAASVRGASAEDPRFFATGISLVAHMANPHVPAVHMNLRYLETAGGGWFGGGADLNPALPRDADTAAFKAALKAACDAHGADYWSAFSAWCDDYFRVPHRGRSRGVGGIFFDHLATGWEADFAFVQAVGEAFLLAYPAIVRANMGDAFGAEDRLALLRYRGLYAEFNLVYDRGTLFGLKTGGNIDAILMSLPPEARWD